VKGHDFSRADEANQINRALAPEGTSLTADANLETLISDSISSGLRQGLRLSGDVSHVSCFLFLADVKSGRV